MFKKEVNRLKSKNLKLLVFIEHTAMFIEVRVIEYSTVVFTVEFRRVYGQVFLQISLTYLLTGKQVT